MKIFVRLYFGIVIILVAVMLVSSLILIRTSLNKNIDNAIENSVERHKIVQSLLRSNITIVTRDKLADIERISIASQRTMTTDDLELTVLMDGAVTYGDSSIESDLISVEEGIVRYEIKTAGYDSYIECASAFSMRNVRYTCITRTYINNIIESNNSLRHTCRIVYVASLVVGIAFAFVFSLYITKPIRRLSEATEAISKGDYSHRIDVVTNDELGQLTQAYNSMSDTISEKMIALENSVTSKEDFIAAFAHETKTPITGIIGYADLLYQGKLHDNDIKEAAGVILSEAERLQSLSSKLLELTDLDRSSSAIMIEQISSSDLENDLKALYRIESERRGVDISIQLGEGYFWADYALIRIVITNLIDNAMKAEAKQVTVTGDWMNGNPYTITVVDNGLGIPEDKASRVKEAFYMVDKSRSRAEHGVGLGLTLCDKIMRLHGGTMDIVSKEGEGTRIILKLPNEPDKEGTR
ncbi:MAG: HAMP domain-containing histidine kinase [Clostridiales bacterium]|nr:HAMP domain-containing histidine kinase [Clostridiales bacterium]